MTLHFGIYFFMGLWVLGTMGLCLAALIESDSSGVPVFRLLVVVNLVTAFVVMLTGITW